MPWKCPSCRTSIIHSELEAKPRPRIPYCCQSCGSELIFNPAANVLIVAPLDKDGTIY
jgi:hypothetical protein